MSSFTLRLAATGVALTLASTAFAPAAFAQTTSPAGGQGGGLILPGSISSSSDVVAPGQPGTAPAPAAPAAPMAPQAAPAPRPEARAPQPPRRPTTPANPVSDWQVRPQVFSDGTFKACEAQAGFDNHLTLVFLALPVPKAVQEKEKLPATVYNMVIGIPDAHLPPAPEGPTLTLKVDGKLERVMKSAIIQPDAIMLGLDPKDTAFIKALPGAAKLEVANPNDTAMFSLKSFAKGFKELNSCVAESLAGKMKLPAPPPMIPPGFAKMMIAAGLSEAHPLPVDKMPPQERRGDYAWVIDKDVFGWLQRLPLAANAPGLDKITEDYVGSLNKACAQGTFTHSVGKPVSLTQADVITANATCKVPQGDFYVDLILYKTKDNSLYIVSHEAKGDAKARAASAGVALAKAIEAEAAKQPSAPPAQPATTPGK